MHTSILGSIPDAAQWHENTWALSMLTMMLTAWHQCFLVTRF